LPLAGKELGHFGLRYFRLTEARTSASTGAYRPKADNAGFTQHRHNIYLRRQLQCVLAAKVKERNTMLCEKHTKGKNMPAARDKNRY
jgi:hypothetical protein